MSKIKWLRARVKPQISIGDERELFERDLAALWLKKKEEEVILDTSLDYTSWAKRPDEGVIHKRRRRKKKRPTRSTDARVRMPDVPIPDYPDDAPPSMGLMRNTAMAETAPDNEIVQLIGPDCIVADTQIVFGNVIIDKRFCSASMRYQYLSHQLLKGRLSPEQALRKVHDWMIAERLLHPNMAPSIKPWTRTD